MGQERDDEGREQERINVEGRTNGGIRIMSGFIDGTSKFYIVYHDSGSMHFEGYKNLEDLAMGALTTHAWKGDGIGILLVWFARMEAFKTHIDELVSRAMAEASDDGEEEDAG
jgi:hypothetical protein